MEVRKCVYVYFGMVDGSRLNSILSDHISADLAHSSLIINIYIYIYIYIYL